MAFEKKYDPKTSEEKIRKYWEDKEIYKFDKNTKKKIFSIDSPPPTLSGRMHIGHAFSYTQQDFIARYKRMKGFEVFFPFGTDDNGLATEKLVQKEKGIDLRKVSRDEAIKICLEYLKEETPNFIQDWKNIGASNDFELSYSTIDEHSRKISQKSFLELAKKGLVYRKEGPVLWDRVFQTAIAQAELEDKKLKSHLNYIKAKISKTENTFLIYATTRPELLFGCVGISVEEKGEYVKLKVGNEFWITGAKTYKEKFKDFDYELVEKLKGQDLIGQNVIIPLSNIEVDISDDISVKAGYGTGIVYFCTYGGVDCIEWMSRHPEKKPISLLEKNGKLNEKNGKYVGMLCSEARSEIIKDLETSNDLIKKEEIEHTVNVGERSGVEVEYIISSQLYVKYLDKKEYLFEQAQKLNWYPDYMKHRLENWIKGLKWDWGISRQRQYGVPIPVWYDKEGKIYLPEESELPIDPKSSRPKKVPKEIELIPESDVFDTWFTSGSTPTIARELIQNEKIKKQIKVMDLRPQAHDIINFWLFYTMSKNSLIYEENPFKNVIISGWVLAPNGSKMSKSKGNTIKPQDITDKYSNDALRFAAAAAKLGLDQPFQEKEVQTGIKIANKLYNANKFASMILEDFKPTIIDIKKLDPIDKWILAKLQSVLKESNEAFENFDYQKAKAILIDFFMSDIADNYIEIAKQRLWQKTGSFEGGAQTLYHILYSTLRGIAPFMPFITEEIYLSFYKNFEEEISIHKTKYPEPETRFENKDAIKSGEEFLEIVSEARKYKSQHNLSMKDEIEVIEIFCDEKSKNFILGSIEDLKAVTSAKEIKFREISGEKKIIINGKH